MEAQGTGDGRVVEGEQLWAPTAESRAAARVTRYLGWLADEHGLRFDDYDSLWRWSVTDVPAFWQSVWDYFGVLGDRGDGPVYDGDTMPGVSWFPGATLNYARNILRHAADRPDAPAIVFANENGVGRRLTYAELAAEVGRVAAGLRALGVGKGDRVVAYVPNIPEATIAFLATASLGAVWSSCSPDFGAPSVIDRFTQIEPTVLVAVDGYQYGGKPFDRRATVARIAGSLPTLRATVLIDYLAPVAEEPELTGAVPWSELGADAGAAPEPVEVPFGHPLWVVYSSGTTGLPKPIVHGHGGIVLEHLKSLTFHQDVGPGDVFFWFSTTGWMMWNYLVGSLLTGATAVLYDGSPAYPHAGALWEMAEETGVTFFGTSAPYITSCLKEGLEPGRAYGLSRLKAIGSTGSPLTPEGFAWVYRSVRPDLLLGSFSGGTDLATGFIGPSPLLPVRAGVLACRMLGCRAAAYDPAGKPVVDEVGELVITEPMPSMPVFFWNDPEGTRYHEAYFDTYPGIWRHGDWIKVLPDGGCVIYGRSDSTLNRGGVRMGTSEFYRVVEGFDDVADSLVIDTGRLGQEGRLILFLTPAEGHAVDDDLVKRLKTAIRTQLSPRHVPDEIHEVPGVPRTLSGKKLEVPVRKILLGTPVDEAANRDALANPEVLPAYTKAVPPRP
ncbi:MAG TPA: acetoacetate--CoA ligase [Streptosporangiaceae bacterium]|jgi:acetoacetyl-CoA synthetase